MLRATHKRNDQGQYELDCLGEFNLTHHYGVHGLSRECPEEGAPYVILEIDRNLPVAPRIDGSYPKGGEWLYLCRLSTHQAAGLMIDHCHALTASHLEKNFLNKGYHVIPRGECDYSFVTWLQDRVDGHLSSSRPLPEKDSLAVYCHDGSFWLLTRV